MNGSPHDAPLIALISATELAIAPAAAGFAAEFPEAQIWNLLDDRLLVDANRAGGVTSALWDRMTRLIAYAEVGRATGILLTCSLYGPVGHAYTGAIPVAAADDGAFSEVVDGGYRRILLMGSITAAVEDARNRLLAHAGGVGALPEVFTAVPPRALEAATSADPQALTAALADGYAPFAGDVDAILLAQYSMAPAAQALSASCAVTVVSGPAAAARRMRTLTAATSPAGSR